MRVPSHLRLHNEHGAAVLVPVNSVFEAAPSVYSNTVCYVPGRKDRWFVRETVDQIEKMLGGPEDLFLPHSGQHSIRGCRCRLCTGPVPPPLTIQATPPGPVNPALDEFLRSMDGGLGSSMLGASEK